MWEAWFTIGALVGFALLAWWARNDAAKDRERELELDGLEQLNDIKERSDALRKAASAARDPGDRYLDDRVSTTPLPDADYRD